MECKNCKTSFAGKFCPHCGQKSSVKRLSLLTVFNDFILAITDTERGFLKTILDLSQQPGPMVKNYVAGKRARYLSAGKYTFFLIVLFTVNISLLENHFGFFKYATEKINSLHITDDGFYVENDNGEKKQLTSRKKKTITLDLFSVKREVTGEKALEFIKILMPQVQSTLFDYSKLLIICWIPLFALLTFLFFFRASYNLAEHFTFNAFVFSHMLLIFMVISPLYWVAPQLSNATTWSIFVSMLFYLGFSYMQFFEGQSYRFVKTITVVGIGLTSYTILTLSAIATLMIYLVYQNLHYLD